MEVIIGELLKKRKLTVSTAESCTGGSIAERLTSIAGSSEYFKGSIVAYSNEVKKDLLYVSSETLEKYGAVSEETGIEMVKGAMKALKTDCAVATSGIAGPGAQKDSLLPDGLTPFLRQQAVFSAIPAPLITAASV